MVKVPLYTLKGTKTGELDLPKDVFEVKPNLNLLAQAVHVYEERSHTGLRKAKTRSEVNRTTQKLRAQKGSGHARHGSRRANLFVGGGVALGPRPVRKILKLSKLLKNKSKAYAFSAKAGEKEILAISGLSKIGKTKEAAEFLAKIGKDSKIKRFSFVLSEKAKSAFRFLRNLGNANTFFYKDINAYEIWNGGLLILDKEIFESEKKTIKPIKKAVVRKLNK